MKQVARATLRAHNTASPMGNQVDGRWKIRSAQPDDWRAARMLLPQTVHFGTGSAVLIVESSDDHRIIAAAAIAPRLRSDPPRGARLGLHVIAPWRKQGIAKALIAQAEQIARRFGAQALFGWDCAEENSEVLRAWRALGFVESAKMQIGIMDPVRALDYLGPIYQQLLERGWIPPQAKIIPARQADPWQIAKLHARYLGGTAQQVMWRMTGQMIDPFDLELSPALLLNGIVKAFTLVRMAGENCHVEATVVDPALRGGWANAWLKYEGISWARAAGAKALIFQTYDQHTDTRKFSKQVGGTTRHLIEPYRIIAAGAIGASGASQAAPGADAHEREQNHRMT